MANITFQGIRLFPRKDSQPEWVIASGVITPDAMNAFLIDNKEHESEYQGAKQFRIQVLKGKDGSPYVVLDTYKAAAPAPSTGFTAAPLPEDTDGLPF